MSRTTTTPRAPRTTPRIAPTVPVAIGVFVAYVVVFIGLSSSSGVGYDQWFATGSNAFRSAVVPLIGASALLIAFLLWARWDWVFRDPARLPMFGILWVPIVLFGLAFVGHLAFVDWSRVPTDLLLAIVMAGVLVGFAEETMFRGVILRALRANGRAEGWVVVISSLWFGFFHLTNLLNGSPAANVIGQCVLASGSGVVLYLFRRWRGLLVLGMIAHGCWDISAFLPATSAGAVLNLFTSGLVFVSAVVAAVVLLRRERPIESSRLS